MNPNMKRTLILYPAGIVAVALLTVLGGYLWSYRQLDVKEFPHSVLTLPGTEIPLGGKVEQLCTVTLPLCAGIGEISVKAPSGVAVTGQPEKTFKSYLWSQANWSVRAWLCPLAPGETKPGEMVIQIKLPGNKTELLTVPIPALTALPVEAAGEDLPLAGEVTPSAQGNAWLYTGAIAAVLAILAILIWLGRRQQRLDETPPPPWMRAAFDLAQLKTEIRSRKIDLEAAFVRLTDLVRRYLEERYALPASSRTTDEFLEELKSPASPLPSDEQPFLKEFMIAADLVKFAKLPPDEAQLLAAVDGAEHLVEHTVPVIEKVEGGLDNV